MQKPYIQALVFFQKIANLLRCVEECNITFIGPKAETIDAMGNKINARRLMQAAGVPVIPGSDGVIQTVEEALTIAERIGYPVMLKAAAGGGGKGIRKVCQKKNYRSTSPQRNKKQKASFGNGDMYLEKLLPGSSYRSSNFRRSTWPYHSFGRTDCSLQRNNQKVLEESPSIAISKDKREKLGATAVRAAKAVQYENAGTIEFLMDTSGKYTLWK